LADPAFFFFTAAFFLAGFLVDFAAEALAFAFFVAEAFAFIGFCFC
jgi:hypothetical protein